MIGQLTGTVIARMVALRSVLLMVYVPLGVGWSAHGSALGFADAATRETSGSNAEARSAGYDGRRTVRSGFLGISTRAITDGAPDVGPSDQASVPSLVVAGTRKSRHKGAPRHKQFSRNQAEAPQATGTAEAGALEVVRPHSGALGGTAGLSTGCSDEPLSKLEAEVLAEMMQSSKNRPPRASKASRTHGESPLVTSFTLVEHGKALTSSDQSTEEATTTALSPSDLEAEVVQWSSEHPRRVRPPVHHFKLDFSNTTLSPCILQPVIGYVADGGSLKVITASRGTLAMTAQDSMAYAWVTCNGASRNFKNFFSAGMSGDLLAGAQVHRLKGSSKKLRTGAASFEISWRLLNDTAGEVFLNVEHWRTFDHFTGENACKNKAEAGAHNPLGHVAGSPMRFQITQRRQNGERDGAPLGRSPRCGGPRLPAEGQWVKWRHDNQTTLGPAKTNGEGTAAAGDDDGDGEEEDGPLGAEASALQPDLFDRMGILVRAESGKETPFTFQWHPRGCQLRDMSAGEFIDSFSGDGHTQSRTQDISMDFVGDSTMYYMCKTWATVLSEHSLRVHSSKFSALAGSGLYSSFGPFRSAAGSSLIVTCHHDGVSTRPHGQLLYLQRRLRYAMKNPDHGRNHTRIFVVGDSNAHTLCHEGVSNKKGLFWKEALTDTRELVKVARLLSRFARTRVVWVGPVYIARSYTMLAARLAKEQAKLWHAGAAENNTSFLAVEPWDLAKPLVFSQSEDGLHYHSLLDRRGQCDSRAKKMKRAACEDSFQMAGPVPISVMKLVVNGLLNSIELTLGGPEPGTRPPTPAESGLQGGVSAKKPSLVAELRSTLLGSSVLGSEGFPTVVEKAPVLAPDGF